MFNKVLIANRGEIACRIIHTLRKLNITSVAIYSYADEYSRHVLLADEAICIGNSPAVDSYLNIEKIIKVATENNVDAIHPGYGFLSENSDFANAVSITNIKFIGPSSDVIAIMGNKAKAKDFMRKSGVPLLPGDSIADDNSNADAIAKDVGFPMLVKASAGGGGKGMRIVNAKKDLISAIESCRREAQKSFNDSHLIAEKYLTSARHIEVQVAADMHGNVIHLFERDCSMQRRYQKVIEEAPAYGISQDLKEKLFDCVVKATKELKYEGVGTFEFLFENNEFYFLEVNTRLQVEHPVTELVTNMDLVELQLIIASGGKLPAQKDISCRGHAIECRIYAEDPQNDFLPATGKVDYLSMHSDGARIDSGILPGTNVSMFYDPMLEKLITYGQDRESATKTMDKAINDHNIFGVTTNLDFLRGIIGSKTFKDFNYHTKSLDNKEIIVNSVTEDLINNALIIAALLCQENFNSLAKVNQGSRYTMALGYLGTIYQIKLEQHKDNWDISINDSGGYSTTITDIDENMVILTLDNNPLSASFCVTENNVYVNYATHTFSFSRRFHSNSNQGGTDNNVISSPMSGIVRKINVVVGQAVKDKEVAIIVEAMKMEHSIAVNGDKVVKELTCTEGDFVKTGQVLITMDSK